MYYTKALALPQKQGFEFLSTFLQWVSSGDTFVSRHAVKYHMFIELLFDLFSVLLYPWQILI